MDFEKCKYIVDENGKKVGVVLSIKKYQAMLRKLEDLDDEVAYDKAKSKKGRVLDFNEVIKKLEKKHR